ncbi:MAG TPA: discoidin domain-containing protein, partial [Phycisphaerales bacterium]|nr:discoidin domain-containing protein [Phycisphaerales bacterium]
MAIAGPLVAVPENLALRARISSNSQFSGDYHARFVADGIICPADARNDPGKAWAVRGDTHRNGAELVFEWAQSVQVGQIIYYGRTAWFVSECWKDFEVYTDDGSSPVLVGTLEMRHGPQRITLPRPATAEKLVLRFTSSYGGPNPGASEVQVFATALSDVDLAEVLEQARLAGDPYYAADRRFESDRLSQALENDLAAGKLGFRSMVVIGRRPIEPSHVYTYHNEGFSPGGGLYLLTVGEDGRHIR